MKVKHTAIGALLATATLLLWVGCSNMGDLDNVGVVRAASTITTEPEDDPPATPPQCANLTYVERACGQLKNEKAGESMTCNGMGSVNWMIVYGLTDDSHCMKNWCDEGESGVWVEVNDSTEFDDYCPEWPSEDNRCWALSCANNQSYRVTTSR